MNSFQLNMKTGPTPGKIIPLTKSELFLGRDLANDIVISDADVSRRHTRLAQQGEDFLVEDLGSTNGTYVNGERLTAPRTLQNGDLIKLGDAVELVFERLSFESMATVRLSEAELPVPEPVAEPVPAVIPEPVPAIIAEPEPISSPTFPTPEPVVEVPIPPARVVEPAAWVQAPYDPVVPVAPKKRNKTWLFIGIGCAAIICLCALAALVIFVVLPLGGYQINW